MGQILPPCRVSLHFYNFSLDFKIQLVHKNFYVFGPFFNLLIKSRPNAGFSKILVTN